MSFTIKNKYPIRGGPGGAVTIGDIEITDCDPNWQFWEFLQKKGQEISPRVNFLESNPRTFIPLLYGKDKNNHWKKFNFDNRLLYLKDVFNDNAILFINDFFLGDVNKQTGNASNQGRGDLNLCAVCLQEMTPQQHLVPSVDGCSTLPCGHMFHNVCVHACFVAGGNRCPVCREDIFQEDLRVVKKYYDMHVR